MVEVIEVTVVVSGDESKDIVNEGGADKDGCGGGNGGSDGDDSGGRNGDGNRDG